MWKVFCFTILQTFKLRKIVAHVAVRFGGAEWWLWRNGSVFKFSSGSPRSIVLFKSGRGRDAVGAAANRCCCLYCWKNWIIRFPKMVAVRQMRHFTKPVSTVDGFVCFFFGSMCFVLRFTVNWYSWGYTHTFTTLRTVWQQCLRLYCELVLKRFVPFRCPSSREFVACLVCLLRAPDWCYILHHASQHTSQVSAMACLQPQKTTKSSPLFKGRKTQCVLR